MTRHLPGFLFVEPGRLWSGFLFWGTIGGQIARMSPKTSQKERKRKTRIPKSTYGFRVQPDSTQSPFSASQAESCGFESRHPLHKKNVQSLVNQGFFLFVINWKMSHLALLGDSWGTNGDRIFPVWPPSLCSRASSRGHRSRRS